MLCDAVWHHEAREEFYDSVVLVLPQNSNSHSHRVGGPTLVNINHPTSCNHRKLQKTKRKLWADISPKAVTHTTVRLEIVR